MTCPSHLLNQDHQSIAHIMRCRQG